MRKPMAKKVIAAVSAAAMAMSMAACGQDAAPAVDTPAADAPAADEAVEETVEEVVEEEVEEEVSPYTIITDENGNPIDLGGMDIIIRNWWSGDPAEPTNDYEEARDEYREWIQETYNFTIKEQAISDWGSTPQDFVDYATTGGDENYVFVLRDDPAITSAMASGLMYDLSTLDCLDFSQPKFQRNKLHTQYAKGDSIYAMYAGFSEARTGVYFNKRLLTDAGIDPESIYDMQADGTWTWDKFDELMGQVQRDTDNDGVIDVYGLTLNEGVMTQIAIASNNGAFVGKDASGAYTYELESPETTEALEWCVDMYTKYDQHDPEGAEWDYYKEEFINGQAAFMVDDEYCGTPGNFLQDMEDEVGFVMFPIGPSGSTYINVWSNNPATIPACYDADKAWKIAFAWDLFTNQPAGYEDYMDLSAARAGKFDQRAVDETITMMMSEDHGTVAFYGLIPNMNIGPDFVWGIGPNADVAAAQEAIRETWKSYIDEANK